MSSASCSTQSSNCSPHFIYYAGKLEDLFRGSLGIALTARAAGTPITQGIVGWWLFNQTNGLVAVDSSGSYDDGIENDGTLTGAAVFTGDATRDQVLNVYNISGEVDMPVSPVFQPVTGTISVWVKPTLSEVADVVREDTTSLVRCNISETVYAYDIRIESNGAPQAVIANDNPKTCNKTNSIIASGAKNTVKPNVWTHLAMVWNGSDVLIYANGVQAGSAAYSPNPTLGLSYTPDQPVKVAAPLPQLSGTYEYEGDVSDLRIYSRALSATEIKDIAVNGQ